MTWDALEQVLEASGYEYARQGSYAEGDPLPESFVTFWNLNTPYEAYYDNDPHRQTWRWQLYFYTKDPALLYTGLESVLALAKAAGFVLESAPFDLASDEPGYVGRTARVAFTKTLSHS